MSENNVNDPVKHPAQEVRGFNVSRDQVLTRLWDMANMDPERTRNSLSAQVKAISMIVAIEGLIPDRRAVAAQKQPVPSPDHQGFYKSAWLRAQQEGNSVDPQTPPAPEESQQEPAPEPQSDPGPLDESQTLSSPPPPRNSWVPDSSSFFSTDKNRFRNDNRFGRRR
jgi:hypothetical protein